MNLLMHKDHHQLDVLYVSTFKQLVKPELSISVVAIQTTIGTDNRYLLMHIYERVASQIKSDC